MFLTIRIFIFALSYARFEKIEIKFGILYLSRC